MIRLISGVTCTGKSTWIERAASSHKDTLALFPHQIRRAPELLARGATARVLVHFNISSVRYAHQPVDIQVESLLNTALVQRVLTHPFFDDALVLTAPPDELMRRCRQRRTGEPGYLTGDRPGYPSGAQEAVLTITDTDALVRAWSAALQRLGVAVETVDTTRSAPLKAG